MDVPVGGGTVEMKEVGVSDRGMEDSLYVDERIVVEHS